MKEKLSFKTLKHFIPAIGWGGLLIILSLIPSNSMPKVRFFLFKHFDKLVHLGFYAVLTALLLFGFSQFKRERISWQKMLLSVAVPVGLGVILEYLQASLSINRNFENADIIANISGSILACLGFIIITKSKNYEFS